MDVATTATAVGTTTNNILDKIPVAMEFIRNLMIKLTGVLHLPGNGAFLIFAAMVSLVLAFLFIKQFIVSGWA